MAMTYLILKSDFVFLLDHKIDKENDEIFSFVRSIKATYV